MTKRIKTKMDVALKRKARTGYMAGVNTAKSFKGLGELSDKIGVDIPRGDTICVDNTNGDKRKAMKRVRNNGITYECIVYARIIHEPWKPKHEFIALREGTGLIDGQQPLLSFFD